MNRRLAPLLIVYIATASTAQAIESTFVTDGIGVASGGGGVEYDSATVNVFVNPVNTKWIAWNGDFPTVALTDAARPGETFLGPHGIGIDDFIRLTITNPLSQSLSIDIDQNLISSQPTGPQAVLFGIAADAPDVRRGNFFLDEAGAFNSIFTTAGNYRFDFSFRDQFAGSASHGDIWLLVEPIPEPATGTLALGALAVVCAIAARTFGRQLCERSRAHPSKTP